MVEIIKNKYQDKMCKEFEVIRDTLVLLRESSEAPLLEDCATDILTEVHKSFKELLDSDEIIDVMKGESLQDKVTNHIKKGMDDFIVAQINILNKEIHKLS